jgi:excisionase family DNA binding protein
MDAMTHDEKNQTSLTQRRTYDLWPTVGQMLGLSRGATYNAAKLGDIPTIRIGGRILVPRTALERLIEGPAGN